MTHLYTLIDLTAPGVFLSGLTFWRACNLAEIGDWGIMPDQDFTASQAAKGAPVAGSEANA